jgi:hypothetical protein
MRYLLRKGVLRESFTKYIETCMFIYNISKFIPSGAHPSPSPFKAMLTVIASIVLHNFNLITSNIAL